MNKIKDLFRPIYHFFINYKSWRFFRNLELKENYRKDLKLYKKYSLLFSKKDLKQKEADLILQYHSLEKGFLHENMKIGFAKPRILILHKMLQDEEIVQNANLSQIKTAYQVMCEYYELHLKNNYDIKEIYTQKQYEFYINILNNEYTSDFSGVLNWDKDDFYKYSNSNFNDFAHSRKSIREFTSELISHETLTDVIQLANTAPSVCNRQASNVYLIENKTLIDKILKIQGGFSGFIENVHQLLILTNDRKYYYTVGERNQLYIDGGLYLMNLLYALHFHQIGNCPVNWGMPIAKEKQLDQVIQLPESEKIICMIPIGISKNNFRTTLSCRRNQNENFKILS